MEVESLNPVTVPCWVLSICIFICFYLFIYINNWLNIIHSYIQIIWVAELYFNDSKQCMPYLVDAFHGISHMHFVFANVPFT